MSTELRCLIVSITGFVLILAIATLFDYLSGRSLRTQYQVLFRLVMIVSLPVIGLLCVTQPALKPAIASIWEIAPYVLLILGLGALFTLPRQHRTAGLIQALKEKYQRKRISRK